MKNHFIKLFEYDIWANRRLIIAMKGHDILSDRILTIFSHILSAQLIWLNRILDLSTAPFPVWEKYNIQEIESMTEESNGRWIQFIQDFKFETFKEVIHYTDSNSQSHENSLQEIMIHVLNHSAHHRGQLAMLFREAGIDPPANDYIIYKRI